MGADDFTLPGWTYDPEDESLIRPSDVNEYAWGQPSPYQDKQVMATGFAAKAADNSAEASRAESNALEYLRASLQKSADVSPSQGFAAALLAAVPTLGGYLIGKSVGAPELPAGIRGFDVSKYQTGAMAGGAAGAALGNKISGDYLGALDADQAQKNSIYEKMAALESAKATRLGTRADQYDLAGLNANEQRVRQEDAQQFTRDMLPLQRDSQIAVQQAGLQKQKDFYDYQITHPDPGDAARQQQADRLAEQQRRKLAGEIPLDIPNKVAEAVATADSISVKQERLRALYNAAIQQIGPGAVQSMLRSGAAKVPGTIQNEFMGTLNAVAMELNKLVDPTPSDAGRLAQLQKLQSSLESGHFLDMLDYETKNARTQALSGLDVYTQGSSPNAQALSLKNTYAQKWGMAPPMSKEEFFADFLNKWKAKNAAR